MNVFTFIGNLTKDAELQYSGEGKGYAKFTVAVPRRFNREEADFFYCVAFGKQAENIAEYCKKGSKVGVVGQVKIDRKDDKTYTNVIVDSVEFLTPKGSVQRDPFAEDGTPIDIKDDDLPF